MQATGIRAKYGSGPAMFSVSRSMMAMYGLDLGPPRLPLVPMETSKYKQLEAELTELGLFEWIP